MLHYEAKRKQSSSDYPDRQGAEPNLEMPLVEHSSTVLPREAVRKFRFLWTAELPHCVDSERPQVCLRGKENV